MNNIKTLVLLVTLTLVLVWVGGAIGGKQGMTIALIFTFGMNFVAYWFSDKIVLRMYGAREVTESEAPELFGIVRRLAQRAEIPIDRKSVV
jgi:heat shock protein HtpX